MSGNEMGEITTRLCTSCQKILSLNLFRRDESYCRFCEVGLEAPFEKIKVKNEEKQIPLDELTEYDEVNNKLSVDHGEVVKEYNDKCTSDINTSPESEVTDEIR